MHVGCRWMSLGMYVGYAGMTYVRSRVRSRTSCVLYLPGSHAPPPLSGADAGELLSAERLTTLLQLHTLRRRSRHWQANRI